MKGKISSKAENSNDAGKTWYTVGIDGKPLSTFDKKLYDKYGVGEEVNYDTKINGKYTNLSSMWKDGETAPVQKQLPQESNSGAGRAAMDLLKEESMRRFNSLNNASALIDVLQREEQLDGRNSKEILEIYIKLANMLGEYLRDGKIFDIEATNTLFAKAGGV